MFVCVFVYMCIYAYMLRFRVLFFDRGPRCHPVTVNLVFPSHSDQPASMALMPIKQLDNRSRGALN